MKHVAHKPRDAWSLLADPRTPTATRVFAEIMVGTFEGRHGPRNPQTQGAIA